MERSWHWARSANILFIGILVLISIFFFLPSLFSFYFILLYLVIIDVVDCMRESHHTTMSTPPAAATATTPHACSIRKRHQTLRERASAHSKGAAPTGPVGLGMKGRGVPFCRSKTTKTESFSPFLRCCINISCKPHSMTELSPSPAC